MNAKCLFSILSGVILFAGLPPAAGAENPLVVTVLVASNEGNDFDLDNDAFRDRLIQLFSYTSYKQVDQTAVTLEKGVRRTVELPDGYQMHLELRDQAGASHLIQAVVETGGVKHVDTVLAIQQGSAVFVGGPPAGGGSLIIVLEIAF